MTHPGHQMLPLVLFSSAVILLCTSQVPSFSVASDQCVAPTLDYSASSMPGLEGGVYIYTMSPFTSCSGRVVGYWFCYQNTNTITGVRVNISTVVLLEDMGDNYQVVGEFNVMVEPDRDCCPSGSSAGRQYCVSRNLTAERQFGVNSSYLYGVVDFLGGPDMIQTHDSVGRCGYQFNPDEYTQSRQMGNKLMKQGDPSRQPLKMFQFIIENMEPTTTTPTTPPSYTHPTTCTPTSAPPTSTTPPTDPSTKPQTPALTTDTSSSSRPSPSIDTQSPTITTDTSSSSRPSPSIDTQSPTITTDTSSSSRPSPSIDTQSPTISTDTSSSSRPSPSTDTQSPTTTADTSSSSRPSPSTDTQSPTTTADTSSSSRPSPSTDTQSPTITTDTSSSSRPSPSIDTQSPTITTDTSSSSRPSPSIDTQSPTITADTSSSSTDISSTRSSAESQITLLVAGVVATLMVLLVIVVVIVIIVGMIRRRNKDYALQQSSEGPAFMNVMYTEVHMGSLPSSVATKGNYYPEEPGKSGPYTEPLHEHSMSDEIRGNTVRNVPRDYEYAIEGQIQKVPPTPQVPQHYEYAIESQNQEAHPQPQLGEYSYTDRPDTTKKPQGRRELYRSITGIYMTPARDETSLYAQFRTIRIKQISKDAVKIVDHLGSGQFGTVDRGVWQSPEGDIPVAVKTLNPGVKDEDRVKFLQEAAIMGQFSHLNVVKLYGVVTTEQPMMIVLELLPKGDLRNILLSMKTDPEEEATPHTLLSYCRQIAAGMCYLSQKSFIHRDLAARNILVAEDGICKIADFGMSRDLAEENYYISHGGKVPIKWTAPEALNFKKYSAASDVWSYGALMYEIWSLGHRPFEGYTNAQSMKQVDRGYRLPPPPGCPKAMYEVMIQCWHPETSGRPTFAAILQTLSLPDSHLLQWSEADKAKHPEAAMLGAELEVATDLYPKLQQSYLLDKEYETID